MSGEEVREQGEEFSPPPPAPRPSASFQCPMPNVSVTIVEQ
ncbi:MAG: hypothetical protein V7K43_19140 [Nostoc sp.]